MITDWGEVTTVIIVTVSVLLFFWLVRYARRMKISVSKHNLQRIVLGLGLLLVILNGLFVPFEGEIKGLKNSPMVTEHLGYHFILRPPTRNDVFRAMLVDNFSQSMDGDQVRDFLREIQDARKEGKTVVEATEAAAKDVLDENLLSISSHVETSRFWVQLVTIVGTTAGAFFLFGTRNKKAAFQGNVQGALKTPAEKVSNN
jgi:hypothetical protein